MIIRYTKHIFIGLLILGGMSFAGFAYAQYSTDVVPDDLDGSSYGFDTGPTEGDILVDVNPQYPGPFETVSLRTSSDYIDLNRYNHAWFVDGIRVANGIGQRSATVKMKGYGQRTTIVILVQLADTLIKKTLSFEPQDTTLMWEAVDSYVPPFYQGKKLPAREGIIKAVSIPNFATSNTSSVDPKNAVYRWTRNENIVPAANGYGRDAFIFKNNKSRSSEKIRVSVSNLENTSEAVSEITIPLFNPKVLFYEKNPLTGIISPFSKSQVSLLGDTTTLITEPFFFSIANRNPSTLDWNWVINKEPLSIADLTNKNRLALQNPGGSGSATLGVQITNPNSLFQQAQAFLPVTFRK